MNGLASELGAKGQPYNWVFIAGDVSSGVFVLISCWLLWLAVRRLPQARFLGIAILNVAGFAAGTMIDAALPMNCTPSLHTCPSFTQDHMLLAHGIFSVSASVFLFISLLLLWLRQSRHTLLAALLFGYVLFAVVSVVAFFIPEQGNWSQHFYISLCSLWIALFPTVVWRSRLLAPGLRE